MGFGQARAFMRPSIKMTGETEPVLKAGIAEAGAKGDVAAKAFISGVPTRKGLEAAFGKGAMEGDKVVGAPFVGTAEEALSDATGRLAGLMERPGLYRLHPAQAAALAG